MNKKAVSPLISTILLLISAVALGIVVMNWGKAAVLEETKCDNAEIGIITFNETPQICFKEGRIDYKLENNGASAISAIIIHVIGDEYIDRIKVDSSIGPADIDRMIISYDKDKVSAIKKIKFTPSIAQKGKEDVCAQKSIEAENVKEC